MSSDRDVMISVRGLGKSYPLSSGKNRPTTLGEALTHRLRSPFGRKNATETFWALKGVNFDVRRGEVVGVIGRNGAGKSTLLKVLSRITEPTTGAVDLYGRVGSLLEVGAGFSGELSGRENIYLNGAILGMRRAEIARRFDEIVDFAGVEKFLDTPVKRYSSGMYVRLAFAVAAHLESEILIVDEVLAVGDQEFQQKCLGKIRNVATGGRTVLFVSHNIASIRELCDTGIVLERGALKEVAEVETALKSYLERNLSNEITFDKGPLRSVRVAQDEESIRIEADWTHPDGIRLPNLGFVISDDAGLPIAGTNPHLTGVRPFDTERTGGKVVAEISEPRLLDGHYRLSIWFGDGGMDLIVLPHCVSFEVRGMAGGRQHQSPSVVGSVAPRCSFRFS
jgi:lipopolysaccharide transport system ATP-binding protein